MHFFFLQTRKPTLHRCIVTQGPSFAIPAIALTAYGPHHAELGEQSPVIRAVTAAGLNNFSPQQLGPLAVTKQENLWEISLTEQYCGLAPNSSEAATDDYDSMRIFMHHLLFCPLCWEEIKF